MSQLFAAETSGRRRPSKSIVRAFGPSGVVMTTRETEYPFWRYAYPKLASLQQIHDPSILRRSGFNILLLFALASDDRSDTVSRSCLLIGCSGGFSRLADHKGLSAR